MQQHLWQRSASICNPADSTAIKVKPHQSPPADRHSQAWLDWRGNGLVDGLAGTGTLMHDRSWERSSKHAWQPKLSYPEEDSSNLQELLEVCTPTAEHR
eukprot:3091720-Amphidinium_carterae.1